MKKSFRAYCAYYPLWFYLAWVLGWACAIAPQPRNSVPWTAMIFILGPAIVGLIFKIRYDQRSHEITQTVSQAVKMADGYVFTTKQSPLRLYRVHELNLEKGAEIAEGLPLRFRTNMVVDHWNVTYVYA